MGAYIELAAPVRAEDPMDDVAAVWERDWLVGERALSPNTVAAYTADVRDFMAFDRHRIVQRGYHCRYKRMGRRSGAASALPLLFQGEGLRPQGPLPVSGGIWACG